jgi:site-specific DNA-methyltransferase (adenine-specific)
MDITDKIRIYNEDCLEAMKLMPDNAFELAIVDPPYGIGMDNQKVRAKPSRKNTYLRNGENQYNGGGWDNERPSKDYWYNLFRISRNQIVWGANYFCEFLPSGKGWIFWDKLMGENNFSAGEFAFQSIQIRSAKFVEPSMRVQNTRIHPTQKPVKLYEWLLDNYATKGDRILDTHLGSGSIAIACHNRGYDLTAYEIGKDYFEATTKRIQDHIAQLTLF